MSASNSPHGAFSLRYCNQVLVIHAQGVFNAEGSFAMNEALEALWQANGSPENWGVLVDLRLWGGSTAEGYAGAAAARQWAASHGCNAAAWLFDNPFIQRMVMSRMEAATPPYPVGAFNTLGAANAWLNEFGLGPVVDAP